MNQLVKEGLPRASHGRYDLEVCFRWYIQYLEGKILERANRAAYDDESTDGDDGDGGGPATSSKATRHRMLSIEMELKQLELAERRERVISIERVEKDMASIVLEIKTRILSLSAPLAAAVLGETDLAIAQVAIDRSLKRALLELSRYDPDLAKRSDSRA